jgi:hypothetical protein
LIGPSSPRISIASSVIDWFTAAHCSFGREPSGPGTPVFIIAVKPRHEFSRSSSASIVSCASFCLITGSPSTPRSRASALRFSSTTRVPAAATAPRPARSCMSVVMATIQPLPTPPTTFSSGIRASSMKSSLNSASPVIWRSGRTCTSSCSMSIRK